jgi:signal transduction histidine kinase
MELRTEGAMKTLLVLSSAVDLAQAVRAGLDPELCRVLQRSTVEEAEPLVVHGIADACLVDVQNSNVEAIWTLEKLHRRAPACPVILIGGTPPWEWEEQAYVEGASQVLFRPLRPRILSALLNRLWAEPERAAPVPTPSAPPPQPMRADFPDAMVRSQGKAAQSLAILRDFSAILTHSLNAEAMLKHFLLLLRDLLSINRGAIFLGQAMVPLPHNLAAPGSKRLRAAAAVGLPSGLLQHFELSLDSGIGRQLLHSGRILRRNTQEAGDLETQKEFELLGSQVAVPILDRENMLGAAVFDAKITGEPLVNEELELVFHLLEHLGLAIKNIWLHDQISHNHHIMAGIMRELGSACIVIDRDLAILHANRMALRYFKPRSKDRDLEFSDLPASLGTKIYQVLKTGAAVPTFRYESEQSKGTVYNLSIVPFQRQPDGLPASALLMAEDFTQTEQFKHLEIEAANLRLIKDMAVRLVNEVGNALVPLSLHQQVLEEKIKKKSLDLDFLKLMVQDMGDSVRRVTRLASQMRFLARDDLLAEETIDLMPLLQEAFEEARRHQPAKTAQCKVESGVSAIKIQGDRSALKHALSEIMLNALQANPSQPKLDVLVRPEAGGNGHSRLLIDVHDNGTGFTPEALQKAFTPFFTTKVVGVGLGLAVSRKIVEHHRGAVEIVTEGQTGCVRILLPTGHA